MVSKTFLICSTQPKLCFGCKLALAIGILAELEDEETKEDVEDEDSTIESFAGVTSG